MPARPIPRAVLLAFALGGCGGGSPTAAPPPPEPGHPVNAVVFYDEDASGGLEPDEHARIPDVEVMVGGRSARSQARSGLAVVTGVPAGSHPVSVRPETLPPFFAAGAAASVTVPQAPGAPVLLGLTLQIGGNQPNVYMAFGDSITRGDGAPAAASYPVKLQSRLEGHFGGAVVSNRGADATNSFEGVERVARNLRLGRPAYTLVLYGTNDWNDPPCQEDPRCTQDNLRTILRTVKNFRSLPFLATLPPANPALSPADRNRWVSEVNDLLRSLAREEGAFLVDLHRAFSTQADLPRLFSDHVHPSEAGYEVMAQAFFEAIAHGRSAPPGGS